MFTVWFDAAGLRPDMARFSSDVEVAGACRNLIERRFPAPLPLRIRVREKGKTVFRYDRAGAGQA